MTHERKSLRAPVSLSPRYRSASSFELVEGRCMDLSDGGMFIAADLPCDNGTLIKFECQVDGRPEMLRGVGRVVWRRTGGDAAHPSGMGLKFVKLENGSKELILKLVEEAAQRGSVAPAQPMAAAVRQTDSFRPSELPPEGRPSTPSAPSEVKPTAEAAAGAPVAESTPVAPAQEPAKPSTGTTPAASAPIAESKPASIPAPAPATAPKSPAPESASSLPILLALAVGGALLLWLLLR